MSLWAMVSAAIVMAMQALLNGGDEMLILDYPLWTASVSMAGGYVHYLRWADDWQPSIADIESKITPATGVL